MKATELENAKAVAEYMNSNRDANLKEWNKFASEHAMVPFTYSDDDWYRNDSNCSC